MARTWNEIERDVLYPGDVIVAFTMESSETPYTRTEYLGNGQYTNEVKCPFDPCANDRYTRLFVEEDIAVYRRRI
jgi:hypothetical protein